jgi:hypothetical protein
MQARDQKNHDVFIQKQLQNSTFSTDLTVDGTRFTVRFEPYSRKPSDVARELCVMVETVQKQPSLMDDCIQQVTTYLHGQMGDWIIQQQAAPSQSEFESSVLWTEGVYLLHENDVIPGTVDIDFITPMTQLPYNNNMIKSISTIAKFEGSWEYLYKEHATLFEEILRRETKMANIGSSTRTEGSRMINEAVTREGVRSQDVSEVLGCAIAYTYIAT